MILTAEEKNIIECYNIDISQKANIYKLINLINIEIDKSLRIEQGTYFDFTALRNVLISLKNKLERSIRNDT